jgi:hypothetical protein
MRITGTEHMLNAATVNYEMWRRGGWETLTLDERALMDVVRRRLELQAEEAAATGQSAVAIRRGQAAEAIRQGLLTAVGEVVG